MNKRELSEKIARQTKVRLFESYNFIDLLIESFTQTLEKGEKIVLSNFGTFYVKSLQKKRVMNPRSREMMTIPATRIVKFKAARNFKID